MATRLRRTSNSWLRELLKNKHFKIVVNLGCRTDEDQEGNLYSSYFKWNKMIRIDIENYKGVDIISSAVNLPLEDISIDFIFCNWMFYYLTNENRIKAVSEMRRILRFGGEILISYWALGTDDTKYMKNLLSENFQILDFWKLDCEKLLDKRSGRAEIIYGVKNEKSFR